MSNKRTFKKAVDLMGGQLCENMMVSYVNIEEADKKLISDAVGKVLDAVEAARENSNVKFDRGVKAFAGKKEYAHAKAEFFRAVYTKIFNDFNAAVAEALKLYNSALPESVKKVQKEAADK